MVDWIAANGENTEEVLQAIDDSWPTAEIADRCGARREAVRPARYPSTSEGVPDEGPGA